MVDARQSFVFRDSVRSGFFIPHENETGWWWQGENARLASLATAELSGARLVFRGDSVDGAASFASRQMAWMLGANPYDVCFLYGFGRRNVPYMSSNYGHGSQRGGISNAHHRWEGPRGWGRDRLSRER
ncbi:hypothetical protein ACQ86N_18010 [Puia sp. P3]|uniref:hypothetical protein n=1 Tax=Puia sp. P3 TaxID=3423952 RepID=UPI003D66F171